MNLDRLFAESLLCDPAHAQLGFPLCHSPMPNKMREEEVEVCGTHSSKNRDEWGSLALEWRKRNKIYDWASSRSSCHCFK
jgi:hypothetical protein